jgi:hypothetical protein
MNIYRHKVVADVKLEREISYYDLMILLILNSFVYSQSYALFIGILNIENFELSFLHLCLTMCIDLC